MPIPASKTPGTRPTAPRRPIAGELTDSERRIPTCRTTATIRTTPSTASAATLEVFPYVLDAPGEELRRGDPQLFQGPCEPNGMNKPVALNAGRDRCVIITLPLKTSASLDVMGHVTLIR